jgi:hypothetical protein
MPVCCNGRKHFTREVVVRADPTAPAAFQPHRCSRHPHNSNLIRPRPYLSSLTIIYTTSICPIAMLFQLRTHHPTSSSVLRASPALPSIYQLCFLNSFEFFNFYHHIYFYYFFITFNGSLHIF